MRFPAVSFLLPWGLRSGGCQFPGGENVWWVDNQERTIGKNEGLGPIPMAPSPKAAAAQQNIGRMAGLAAMIRVIRA